MQGYGVSYQGSYYEIFLDNDFFSNMQYGFLKGRSSVLQLLSITDEWTSNLDSGGQIDCIYMDSEKACDKVSHGRLISKLEGKYSLESTDPCKSEIRAHLRP